MDNKIEFTIDGKKCSGSEGQFIIDAAMEHGIYIPYLCHMKGVIPAGSCRVCTVKMNNKSMAACTTPLSHNCRNTNIEAVTPELEEMRKTIIELLFVEGNHFCPTCEKSGNCELQALAYRYKIMAPQFPYNFPLKKVDALTPKLYIDRNRCILCKKCIRAIKDEKGRNYFAFNKRGSKLEIYVDHDLAKNMNDETASKAMDNCPVGAIIKKEKGFSVPIGKRKYDKNPIGSDIEK